MTQFLMRVSSICLQVDLPELGQEPVYCQQEQPEKLPARLAGPLVLMQQRLPVV